MPPSFTSLPPEIRQAIYQLLPVSHTVHVRAPSKRPSRLAWPATPLSLACTCRTVYAEYAPLYYSGVRYITGRTQWYAVGLWLEAVKPWAGNTIKTLTIRWVPACTVRIWQLKVLDGGELENAPLDWRKRIDWQRKRRQRARDEMQGIDIAPSAITVDEMGRRRYRKLHPRRNSARKSSRRDWQDAVEPRTAESRTAEWRSNVRRLERRNGEWHRTWCPA